MSEQLSITTVLGDYFAETAAAQPPEQTRAAYAELLTMDGIQFPTPEAEAAKRRASAWAAQMRGSVELNDDGSPIEVGDFDQEAVGAVLRANHDQFKNAERLTSVVDLAFISKAGLVAATKASNSRSPEAREMTVAFQGLTILFKHFVQVGMAVEEWPRPWQDLVATGFDGPSLEFPLDANSLVAAGRTFSHDLFRTLRHDHFKDSVGFAFNILQGISMFCDAEWDQRRLAAAVGLFSRIAPEACEDLLRGYKAQGILPDNIDWSDVVKRAVERASFTFR